MLSDKNSLSDKLKDLEQRYHINHIALDKMENESRSYNKEYNALFEQLERLFKEKKIIEDKYAQLKADENKTFEKCNKLMHQVKAMSELIST